MLGKEDIAVLVGKVHGVLRQFGRDAQLERIAHAVPLQHKPQRDRVCLRRFQRDGARVIVARIQNLARKPQAVFPALGEAVPAHGQRRAAARDGRGREREVGEVGIGARGVEIQPSHSRSVRRVAVEIAARPRRGGVRQANLAVGHAVGHAEHVVRIDRGAEVDLLRDAEYLPIRARVRVQAGDGDACLPGGEAGQREGEHAAVRVIDDVARAALHHVLLRAAVVELDAPLQPLCRRIRQRRAARMAHGERQLRLFAHIQLRRFRRSGEQQVRRHAQAQARGALADLRLGDHIAGGAAGKGDGKAPVICVKRGNLRSARRARAGQRLAVLREDGDGGRFAAADAREV